MTTHTTTDPALDPSAAPLSHLRPGRWEIDLDHSRVGFAIRHLGVSKVRGVFRDVAADLVIGATPDSSSLSVEVALTSIDTANPDRDEHVRSADLLDVAVRPTMSFRSTGVHGTADQFVLVGDLTIGDVTRPVELAVEFGGLETFPADGSRHAGFEATGEISRRDFGLSQGLMASTLLGDAVRIELDVQFVEPTDG
jgi:polyisoprenoid-binding protein YceI